MTFRYRAENQTAVRFDADMLGIPQRCLAVVRNVEYPGEVIVVDRPDPDLGRPLEGDTCFRFVLYTTPRRIPAGQILDARIAMAVPRRSPDRTEEDLGREIRSIREAKALYVVGGDADTAALRRSLDEQEASVRDQLSRREAASYIRGRVYTHESVTVRPDKVFAEPDAASWVQAVAEGLITQAFPDLPFDHEGLPGVVDEDVVRRLYRGLIQGQESEAETVKAFAPLLGLSRPETPQELDAANCPGVTIIGLEKEARDGSMAVSEALEILMSGHGLPRTLAGLYLFVFVRHARAEVGLVEGHSVVLADGKLLESDRITWDILPDVDFDGLLEQLTELRTESSASWSTVVPYAVLLDSSFASTDDEREVAVLEQGLRSALNQLDERVSNVIARLGTMAEVLGTEIGRQTVSDIEDIQALSRSRDLETFRAVAADRFGRPSGLDRALEVLERAEQVAELAEDVTSTRRYLDEMTMGRNHAGLELERDSIAMMLSLDSLLATPSLWGSIEGNFRRLRGVYERAYAAHHAEYHTEASSIARELEEKRFQAKALSRFISIPELGEPTGVDIPARFESLLPSIRTCNLGEDEISFVNEPICSSCSLPMSEQVPHRDVSVLLGELESAMREYNRRIGSEGVRRVLAQTDGDQLDKFVALVQIADVGKLSNILDDGVTPF